MCYRLLYSSRIHKTKEEHHGTSTIVAVDIWTGSITACDGRPLYVENIRDACILRTKVVEKKVVLAQPGTTLFFTRPSPATPHG